MDKDLEILKSIEPLFNKFVNTYLSDVNDEHYGDEQGQAFGHWEAFKAYLAAPKVKLMKRKQPMSNKEVMKGTFIRYRVVSLSTDQVLGYSTSGKYLEFDADKREYKDSARTMIRVI